MIYIDLVVVNNAVCGGICLLFLWLLVFILLSCVVYSVFTFVLGTCVLVLV